MSRIPLSTVKVPQLVEKLVGDTMDFVEVNKDLSILWPWDILHWWDLCGGLRGWIANNPAEANRECEAPRLTSK